MSIFKLFTISSLFILFVACGGEKKALLFQIKTDGNKFQQNDEINVAIENSKNKEIKGIKYSIDGQELVAEDGKLALNIPKVGYKVLKASIAYEDTSEEITKDLTVFAANAPEVYTYEIINTYPHDNTAYTQGLEFHDGVLYESTGKHGRSSLRKVNFETGEVLQKVDMDKTIFGEGLTVFNDQIFMLTWKSKTGYIFNLSDLSKLDNFQYGESKEGWGLTNDGTKLIKSDGTEKIWYLNPKTLVEEGYIQTVTNKTIVDDANELEYVDGKIYANVYQKPSVMIIDATSGAIEGVVNFGGLSDKITKTENWNDKEQVLNGIAYHPERKTFFVTGKDWDKMFEVNIVKK